MANKTIPAIQTNEGNVGIGTTNPAELLDIAASTDNSATAGPKVNFKKGATTKAVIGIGGNYLGQATQTDDLIFRNDAGNILFGFAGAEKMRINSGGNVGIGTASPGATLDVAGSLRVTGIGQIGPLGGYGIALFNAGTNTFIGQSYGRSSGIQFTDAAGSNTVYIANGGNVGIGVTIPLQKLHVVGAVYGTTYGQFGTALANGANATFAVFGSNATSVGVKLALDSDVNRNDLVVAGTNGNVGINIAAPTSKLHVVETTPTGSRIQLGSVSTSALMNANLVNDFLILTAPFNANPAAVSNNNAKWGIKMNGGSTDAPNVIGKSACIYAVSEEDSVGGLGYNRKIGLALHTSPFDLPSVERFRITNIGNVGIGVTNPSNKLQISGGGISFTTSTGLAVPMIGILPTNIAYVGPYNSPADGNSPTLVLFNHARSVEQTWFYASGTIAMSLNGQGRFHIGNLNNAPNCLLSVGPTSATTAVSGMCFGNDASANLYRSAASTIKTDGSLTVVGGASFGGNVGIGSTIPGAKLDINGEVYISPNTAGKNTFILSTNASNDASLLMRSDVTTKVNIQANGTSYFNGGNVGIGVTNPSKKLHVVGSLYWDYNGTAAEEHAVGIQRTVAAANGAFTEIGSLAASPSSIRATFEIFHHDNSTIEYSLFELIANYYVGVTTDWVQLPSRTQAHYAGDRNGVVVDARLASTGGSVQLRLRSIGGAGGAMNVNVRIKSNTNLTETTATGTGATVAGLLGFNRYEFPVTNDKFKATTEGLFILNNGNIGIGTTSPSYKLDVQRASDGVVGYFRRIGATINPALGIYANETGNSVGFNTDYAGAVSPAITFSIASSEKVRIANDGNVGIGITNPTAKLDVVGTVRLSSNLLSHKTASYTTSYPGISSFGADTTDSSITYYDTGKTVPNTSFRGVVWTGKHYIFTALNSNLAYFYDNNFNLITNSYGLNSVSLPLPSGYANPHGAAWDGRYLWVVCYVSGETTASKIVGYDLDGPSGNAAIIAESAPLTNITATYDIEYVDGHFYMVRSGNVYIYRWNGSTIDLINTIVGEAGSITAQAITYDGSYLWVTQNGQPVYKLGLDGYQDAVITSGFPPNVCGWAWNGSNIVTFDFSNRNIFIINTTRLRIDTQKLALMGGNVGIGTTNPGDKLQVNLNSGENILANIIGNGVSVNNKVSFRLSELGTPVAEFSLVRDGTSYQTKLQTVNTSPLSFGTSGTTKMVIDTVGYVGIGITNPTARLQVVQSNAGGVAAILLSSDESTIQGPSANTQIRMGSNLVLNGSNILTLGTNNVTRMVIDVTGNVGIGTVAPTAQNNYKFLQVNGQNSAIIEAMVNNVRIGGIDSDSSRLYFGSIGSFPIVFRTAVVEKMRITAAGLVGIGTASPTTLLSVGGAGSTSAASGITLGGDAEVNLYRVAENTLQTDAAFQAVGSIYSASYFYTAVGQIYGSTYGNLTLFVGNSAGNAWQEGMFIKRGSYVGIGTTNPTGKLHVVSSVAGETVLRTDGTNGTLFSVVDDLSDSLMSVNNSAGLPVLEVFADDRVVAGQYGSGDFVLINNKVGLGTSNPTNKLSVIGGASIGSSTYNVAAPSNGLIVEGKVGIGTTNPVSKLHVKSSLGQDGIMIDATTYSEVAFKINGGTAKSYLSLSSAAGGYIIGSSANSLIIRNDSDIFMSADAGATSNITIKNGGNVGIGTASPNGRLDVRTAGQAGVPALGTAGNGINLTRTDGNTGGSIGYTTEGHIYIQSQRFDSVNANDLFLQPVGGNLGIGLTTPAYRLQVSGDVSIAGTNILRFGTVAVLNTASSPNDIYANIRVLRNESTVNTDGMYIGYNSSGTTAAHLRFYANAGNERMRIDASNGHVGIGTTNPATRLHIENSGSITSIATVRIVGGTGNNAGSQVEFYKAQNAKAAIGLASAVAGGGTTSDDLLLLSANPASIILNAGANGLAAFKSDGNVGIGLTNPAAARLHIKGNTTDPVLRVETALLEAGATTSSKTFVAWLPIMTGAAVGDKVFIPLFK